jgi:hypothetical protein
MTMWHRTGLLVLAGGVSLPLHAQWLDEHLDKSLSLRGDVWSVSRRLDNTGPVLQGSAWGSAKLDLGSAGRLVGSGWLRELSRDAATSSRGRVRELYWRYSSGAVEWKIGRQMIAWGRADGINPTDNLSPRDFTLLEPEDADLRYGNETVQMNLRSDAGTFSAIWFPRTASHTVPLVPLPMVSYEVERAPRHAQWALKWDVSGKPIDWSASYFDGIDPTPDLAGKSISPAGVVVAVRNHPLRVFGADMSFERGGTVWRAEAAWTQTRSQGRHDFLHKKPQIWLVAGPEFTLPNNTTLGVQGTLLHVRHFGDPNELASPVERAIAVRQAATSNQTSPTQFGLTWRLSSRLYNDTLQLETSGILTRPRTSGVWRTKLDYAVNDHLHLQAGSDYYFGKEQTLLGQLHSNSLVYFQARYGW